MEYVNLGKTDIKVSKVCLGCMGFGEPQAGMHSWTLPYEESQKIIKLFLKNRFQNHNQQKTSDKKKSNPRIILSRSFYKL